MRLLGLVAAVLFCVFSASSALAGAKVALVMGNSAYRNVTGLTNPKNDATDFAAALERVGFDVTLALDLDSQSMRAAMRNFSTAATGAEMAVIYFAGHGIEMDNTNYLIPVDAQLENASDVLFEAIPLDFAEEAVAGATSLRMILLDACRNNPFLASLQAKEPNRGLGRGLSDVEPVGGTLVAFAAKSGTVAMDGSGRNSPFMAGLLAHIEEPGVDIMLMMRKVRDSVLDETANRQEPFVYGSLPGEEVYIVPPVEVAAVPQTQVVVPSAPVDNGDLAWRLLQTTRSVDDLQEFIVTYPQSSHVSEAVQRIVEIGREGATAPTPIPTATPTPSPTRRETEDDKTADKGVVPREAQQDGVDVAALTPEAPVVAPIIELAGPELARAVQTELARLGCEPGAADGIWGRKSRVALAGYARDAGVNLAARTPTPSLLDELKARAEPVCVSRAAYALPSSCISHFNKDFSPRAFHRAYAISADGRCGASWLSSSPQQAEADALAQCEEVTGRRGTCVIYDTE